MIIVRIHFGLGNQLFQYAFARSFSLQKGVDFCLDTSYFQRLCNPEHPRVYQLQHFNIRENIASQEQVAPFMQPSPLVKKWRQAAYLVLPYYKRKLVYEMLHTFDEKILRVKDNTYLHGFWQDERYFAPVEDILRKELTFKTAPSCRDKEVLQQMAGTTAVSIHIRRGDYLTDQYVINFIGICTLEYYYQAVERIAGMIKDPVFYIFSDDAEWVREHFCIPYPVVIVHHNSQENSYSDLRLMSNCRYHIISNSTFSWWAAWLAPKENKIVIAPKTWRYNSANMFQPEGWLAL